MKKLPTLLVLYIVCTLSSCIATASDIARIEGAIQAEFAEAEAGNQSLGEAVAAVKGEVRDTVNDIKERGEAAVENAKEIGLQALMGLLGLGGVAAGRRKIGAGIVAVANKVSAPPPPQA